MAESKEERKIGDRKRKSEPVVIQLSDTDLAQLEQHLQPPPALDPNEKVRVRKRRKPVLRDQTDLERKLFQSLTPARMANYDRPLVRLTADLWREICQHVRYTFQPSKCTSNQWMGQLKSRLAVIEADGGLASPLATIFAAFNDNALIHDGNPSDISIPYELTKTKAVVVHTHRRDDCISPSCLVERWKPNSWRPVAYEEIKTTLQSITQFIAAETDKTNTYAMSNREIRHVLKQFVVKPVYGACTEIKWAGDRQRTPCTTLPGGPKGPKKMRQPLYDVVQLLRGRKYTIQTSQFDPLTRLVRTCPFVRCANPGCYARWSDVHRAEMALMGIPAFTVPSQPPPSATVSPPSASPSLPSSLSSSSV